MWTSNLFEKVVEIQGKGMTTLQGILSSGAAVWERLFQLGVTTGRYLRGVSWGRITNKR